jgi:AcrR family transcriptional regulator/DNA-binding MarR family transcriptional regulator
MVDTPWGATESLRERRLPPGPGRSSQEVAENQRERLFGAMVASVARRGFAATRLSDLTELSGVSSKSFYELFGDKDDCFLATIEAVLATLPEGADAEALMDWIARQPAAARVLLIEAHAGSPEARERLEKAVAALEARAAAAASPAQGKYPPEMVTAYVGALLEIARTHLRRGAEAELPELCSQLCALLLDSYPPPPKPLRLTSRRPKGNEALDASDHAERILQALTLVTAEEGYAGTTIEGIVRCAGMSPSMFYNHFPSKEEALLAALDSGGARLIAGVLPAFRRTADWPQAVRVAMGALFSQLASRPALAQLLMVEAYAAGPAALERREEALRPLELLWAPARRRAPLVPGVLFEAIQGAIFHLAYKRLRERGARALPGLTPSATYLLLAPFLGATPAAEAANAEARPAGVTRYDPEAVRETALLQGRHELFCFLASRPANLQELEAQLRLPAAVIRHHLAALERADLIERLQDTDSDTVVYRTQLEMLPTEEWSRLSREEREKLTGQIRELIDADLDLSIGSATFDNRLESGLIRAPLTVDEQGFHELSELHARALDEGIEIAERAKERMRQSNEDPIEVRHILAMFEMPPLPRGDEGPSSGGALGEEGAAGEGTVET